MPWNVKLYVKLYVLTKSTISNQHVQKDHTLIVRLPCMSTIVVLGVLQMKGLSGNSLPLAVSHSEPLLEDS